MCDDCLFELGLEEYDWYSPTRSRYRCSRCQELVPSPGPNNNFLEDRILEYMDRKMSNIKEGRKFLPITFHMFRKNCKHYKKTDMHRCYYVLNLREERQKRKRSLLKGKKIPKKRINKQRKQYVPDICEVKDCPIFTWKTLKAELNK